MCILLLLTVDRGTIAPDTAEPHGAGLTSQFTPSQGRVKGEKVSLNTVMRGSWSVPSCCNARSAFLTAGALCIDGLVCRLGLMNRFDDPV